MEPSLITTFFKPLATQTTINQRSEQVDQMSAPTTEDYVTKKQKKKLRKKHKRAKTEYKGHTTLAELCDDDSSVLLAAAGSCEDVEECVVLKSDDSLVTFVSPLKDAVILQSSPLRKHSPLRSPRQYRQSPVKLPWQSSPLKRFLSFSESMSSSIPMFKVVHIRQSDPREPFWTLTPNKVSFELVKHGNMPDLTQTSYKHLLNTLQPTHIIYKLPIVTARERDSILQTIATAHPHITVSLLFSHYRTRTTTTNVGARDLLCSIRIKKSRKKMLVVDKSAYPLPSAVHFDLWTDVYRPLNCSEVLGNSQEVSKLYSWLEGWFKGQCFTHVSCEPARNVTSNDESVFLSLKEMKHRNGQVFKRQRKRCYSSDEDEDEDDLCPPRAMLLCGPSGSGKTASVYACAHQLGIKVHEINSCSSRDKSSVLTALREATLSHQVSAKPKPLLDFFKPKGAKVKKVVRPSVSLATFSVILLEEVDVLFPSDKGFWSTVYDLLTSSKRPFIFTCSDLLCELDCPHIKLLFSRPLKSELSLHLRLLSLCHYVNLSSELANQISTSAKCDIRKAFHCLHTWISWSPSNQPMLPSNTIAPTMLSERHTSLSVPWRTHSTLTSQASQCDTRSDSDVLSFPKESTDHWWKVTPVASLSDDNSSPTSFSDCPTGVAMEISYILGGTRQHSTHKSQVVQKHLERCSNIFSLHRSLSHVSMVTDCLPMLGVICSSESQREAVNDKRRFSHYLKHTTVDLSDLKQFPRLSENF